MADRRNTQKNHIRAARDWLGRAEHSLEQDNDVQGDLKLMLAKAELSRVQESPRSTRLKCWGLRLIPAVVALAIVTGVWLLWPGRLPAESVPVNGSEPVLAGSHETKAENPPLAVEPSVVESAGPTAAVSAPANESTVQAAAAPVTVQSQQTTLSPPAAVQPPDPAVVKPPAPETQKLMRSAGKILRQ